MVVDTKSWRFVMVALLALCCGRVQRQAGESAIQDDSRDRPSGVAGRQSTAGAGAMALAGASSGGVAGQSDAGAPSDGTLGGQSPNEAGAAGAAGASAGAPPTMLELCPGDGAILIDESVQADQWNLRRDGQLAVASYQRLGQTFVVTHSGELAGIQISPDVANGAKSNDWLTLTLFRCEDKRSCESSALASAKLCGVEFPNEHARLQSPGYSSPGFFDLSELKLQVEAGETYLFELSANLPAECKQSGVCASYENTTCQSDSDCSPSGFGIGVSVGGGDYSPGLVFVNGVPHEADPLSLSFVTYVSQPGAGGAGNAEPQPTCPVNDAIVSEPTIVSGPRVTGNEGAFMNVTLVERPGQTFTVESAGKLAAIQVSPNLGNGARTSDALILTLSSCNDTSNCAPTSLGSVSICASDFSEQAQELVPGRASPGLFDLSSLDLSVKPGEVYLFELSGDVARYCRPETSKCAWDSHACHHDSECVPGGFGVAHLDHSAYAGGVMFLNGQPWVSELPDLDFVVYVATQP